jgi:uncharacterized protein YodC (DUF2158 family)
MFGTQDDNTRFHPIGLIMVTVKENGLSALTVMSDRHQHGSEKCDWFAE